MPSPHRLESPESGCSRRWSVPGCSRVIDAVQVGAAHVTINRNDHVLVAQPDGRIKRGSDGGFYARDTRFVSGYELTIGGKRPQLLNACTVRFYSARHVMTNPRLVTPELELEAGS